MKIIMAQRAMIEFRGSELFTFDLARALVGRGHTVSIWCPKPGPVSDLLAATGIMTVSRFEDLPFVPDVIHGHQHLPTMAALANIAEVPAVHVWHGARPWVEQVPVHDRIRLHAVSSNPMRQQLRARPDIDDSKIAMIPNFVDTARFDHHRSPEPVPRRAVLYAQDGFDTAQLAALDAAVAANDMTLDKIGYAYGNPVENPETVLPDYDVVFAIGRSAIEALACGCAVIPLVPGLAGALIRPDTLEHWSDLNFSPRFFRTGRQVSADWLREELAHWSAADLAEVTRRIRKDWALNKAAADYEALYERAISDSKGGVGGFGPYLEWLATEADALVWDRARAEAEARQSRKALERALLEASTAQARLRHMMEMMLARTQGHALAKPETAPVIDVIRASGLFDAQWYLETYPEVAEAGLDPLSHYLEWGASEGRKPMPGFDEAGFFAANPHLVGLGISALEHLARQMAHAGAAQTINRALTPVSLNDGAAPLMQPSGSVPDRFIKEA